MQYRSTIDDYSKPTLISKCPQIITELHLNIGYNKSLINLAIRPTIHETLLPIIMRRTRVSYHERYYPLNEEE